MTAVCVVAFIVTSSVGLVAGLVNYRLDYVRIRLAIATEARLVRVAGDRLPL